MKKSENDTKDHNLPFIYPPYMQNKSNKLSISFLLK